MEDSGTSLGPLLTVPKIPRHRAKILLTIKLRLARCEAAVRHFHEPPQLPPPPAARAPTTTPSTTRTVRDLFNLPRAHVVFLTRPRPASRARLWATIPWFRRRGCYLPPLKCALSSRVPAAPSAPKRRPFGVDCTYSATRMCAARALRYKLRARLIGVASWLRRGT